MIWKTRRNLACAALVAASVLAVAAGQSRATTVTSGVALGIPNGGSVGSFSATLSLGAGSQLQLGASAIAGNYKSHIPFVNTNIGFSAQNQNANLSMSNVGISTLSNTGVANLNFDDVTPGTPLTVNSFSSVLSDGASAPLTINSTSINMSTSIGTFGLTPTFTGTLKNVTFTSTGSAPVFVGTAAIPGNFTVTIGGTVTGSLSVLGIPLNIGTLATLPDSVVTFPGALPANVVMSDTGVPFGINPTTLQKNNALVDFNAALGAQVFPFSFTTALATNQTFSVPSQSSGVTSIKIQNTTLVANVNLTNLSFHENGIISSVLVPEPSSLALGSMALVGLVGFAIKRRKAS